MTRWFINQDSNPFNSQVIQSTAYQASHNSRERAGKHNSGLRTAEVFLLSGRHSNSSQLLFSLFSLSLPHRDVPLAEEVSGFHRCHSQMAHLFTIGQGSDLQPIQDAVPIVEQRTHLSFQGRMVLCTF